MSESNNIAVIRELAEAKRLPAAATDRWVAMEPESRAAILGLVRNLRMRTAQIMIAVETLDEIAVREGARPAEILARADLKRIVGGPGSAPARASALIKALRAIRYPRLTAALAKLRLEVRALRLPATISLGVPKDLASDELTISLKIRSVAALEHALDVLAEKKPGLRRIIGLLGGER
ncbi:MAG TPA: hypothetical protein VMT58_02910 [Candidatus Binataceae bacterium]|nr:hypothetical protein [Candidatus Binataceae bacterium]